jgi:hypothetical protein
LILFFIYRGGYFIEPSVVAIQGLPCELHGKMKL